MTRTYSDSYIDRCDEMINIINIICYCVRLRLDLSLSHLLTLEENCFTHLNYSKILIPERCIFTICAWFWLLAFGKDSRQMLGAVRFDGPVLCHTKAWFLHFASFASACPLGLGEDCVRWTGPWHRRSWWWWPSSGVPYHKTMGFSLGVPGIGASDRVTGWR